MKYLYLFGIFSAIFITAGCFECYSCDVCPEKFDAISTATVNCDYPACGKQHLDFFTGESNTLRGCWIPDERSNGAKISTTGRSKRDMSHVSGFRMYSCREELCNNAIPVAPTLYLFLLATISSIYVVIF